MQPKPVLVKAITVEWFYTAHAGPLQMELAGGTAGLRRKICEPTVNRPGLALAGFYRYMANKRVQVVGNAETAYLKSLSSSERRARIRAFMERRVPCVVFARHLLPLREFVEEAE
ncbi:MAG: HPr(Ser) kinase/phosphatase, partial [Verrucomicrobiae bacterium]|nr:HPr(Ser) kinase/phosphatase [Verrucomicrobiae bacterium]